MRIALVATGGTISSVTLGDGSRSASLQGAELVAAAGLPSEVDVRVSDLRPRGSYSFTLSDMSEIVDAVAAALRHEVDGVVVTHGTDTLEETAMLADIRLDDARPVVFTGAQRTSDETDADGARNLRDAVTVATSPQARGRGVLIAFGGRVLAARATTKTDTTALDAFRPAVGTDIGMVRDGVFAPTNDSAGRLTPHLPGAGPDARVEIIHAYGGMGRTLLDACRNAGVDGLVVQGTGSGNGNPDVLAALPELRAAGIVTVITSRVPSGPLAARYSRSGGGRDLVDAGAILSTDLRASQARVLLATLLDAGATLPQMRAAFAPDAAASSPSTSSRITPPSIIKELS